MGGQHVFVLQIDDLPRERRPLVEKAMLESLVSEPMDSVGMVDLLDCAPCTRWERSAIMPGCVNCRQVLNGTAEEIQLLAQSLDRLRCDFDISWLNRRQFAEVA